MPTLQRLLLPVALGALVVLAACGGGSDDEASEGAAAPSTTAATSGDSSEGTAESEGSDGTSSDRVAADGTTIEGMLSLVPDSDDAAQLVMVSLYSVAAEEIGLSPEGEPGEDGYETERLRELSGTGGAVMTHPSELAGGPRVERVRGELGFQPSDIAAEIQAGLPPTVLVAGVGDFDPDAVLDAAETVQGAQRSEISGVEVVRWLDDGEVNLTLDAPIGRTPGSAGRLGLPDDGVMAYASSDADIAAVLDTVSGDTPSLADREPLAAVARHLDDQRVVGAILSDEPIRSGGEPSGGLSDYAAYGTGGAVVDGTPELVIVLVHDDVDAAEANATALEQIAVDGSDLASGRPWSEMLRDPRVEADGNAVIARFAVESPGMWSQLPQMRASLLAAG